MRHVDVAEPLAYVVLASSEMTTQQQATAVNGSKNKYFDYLFRQIWQRYQMFDASKYVLGPCF